MCEVKPIFALRMEKWEMGTMGMLVMFLLSVRNILSYNTYSLYNVIRKSKGIQQNLYFNSYKMLSIKNQASDNNGIFDKMIDDIDSGKEVSGWKTLISYC
jgi:hypothetical protein